MSTMSTMSALCLSNPVLHQRRYHIVPFSHVENDAVPCAQLLCVICLLATRCSTKVDRKPFGRHVPNQNARPSGQDAVRNMKDGMSGVKNCVV